MWCHGAVFRMILPKEIGRDMSKQLIKYLIHDLADSYLRSCHPSQPAGYIPLIAAALKPRRKKKTESARASMRVVY